MTKRTCFLVSLSAVTLMGCSTMSYQDDPRLGGAVMEAVALQSRQAIMDRADPDWRHCYVGTNHFARGQDGESARAPLQRHQRGLQKSLPPQEPVPLLNR